MTARPVRLSDWSHVFLIPGLKKTENVRDLLTILIQYTDATFVDIRGLAFMSRSRLVTQILMLDNFRIRSIPLNVSDYWLDYIWQLPIIDRLNVIDNGL